MPYSSNDPVFMFNLAQRDTILRTLYQVKAIAEFSPEGTLLHANPLYLQIFGYALDEVRGAHHAIFCEPRYAASSGYGKFWRSLRAGITCTDLCERRTRGGAACWLEATYAPILDTEGRVVRIFKMAGDVTARVEGERLAHEEVRRLSLVADATDNAVLITDGEWRIIYVNSGFTRMFSMPLGGVRGSVPLRALSPQISDAAIAVQLEALKKGVPVRSQELLQGSGGDRYWCSVVTNPITDSSGQLINTVSVITDITDSKMHQVLQHRVLEAIATEHSIGEVALMVCQEVDQMLPELACCVVRLEASGRLDPLAAPRLPRSYLEHLSKQTLHPDMVNGQDAPSLADHGFFVDIQSNARWSAFKEPLMAVGYQAIWCMPILSAGGKSAGAVVFHYPASRIPDSFHRKLMEACVHLCALALERDRAKARIHRLAFYDPLTNLPNRSLLGAKADQALATARRSRTSLAVVFLDLDRFKHVNDFFGHPAGDLLLKTVADRLQQDRRTADIVCRLSGDEFVLVLPACDALQATEAVERIQLALRHPVELGNANLRPSASFGIAMFPADGSDLDTLMHRADIAMYQAKSEARGSFAFFSDEVNAHALQRLALEADLSAAVQQGELHLNYQPQMDLQSNTLHGVEVLTRWTHPVRGQIPPNSFIPLAEECGLIGDLSRWVLKTACMQFFTWRLLGFHIPTISINLSPMTLHDVGFPALVKETLQANSLKPSDLIIEITEGVMLDQHAATMQTIAALEAMGVRLSMDDFGTGYSSLSYLHRLPISELKIDRSFVADLEHRESALPLCKAFVQIGMSLGLTVVAEGVETEEQRRLLLGLGCQVGQGYLFSKPLTERDFEHWIVRLIW